MQWLWVPTFVQSRVAIDDGETTQYRHRVRYSPVHPLEYKDLHLYYEMLAQENDQLLASRLGQLEEGVRVLDTRVAGT